MKLESLPSPFWDHVDAFRGALIRSLVAIGCGFVIAFLFSPSLFHLLSSPLTTLSPEVSNSGSLKTIKVKRERILNTGGDHVVFALTEGQTLVSTSPGTTKTALSTYLIPKGEYLEYDAIQPNNELLVLGPAEGILVTFRLCFWVGLALASPFCLYFLFYFIAPALNRGETKQSLLFICLAVTFFFIGLLFALTVTLPLANRYLYAFNSFIGENTWALSHYFDYTIALLIGNGIAFELCALLVFLVHCGYMSGEWMSEKRRYVIVAIFVIAAFLTPPDILTQLLVALPLIGFYELTILYAKRR